MSMYSMMCGYNPAAGRLLDAINLDGKSVPRIRDVYTDKDFKNIVVFARIGGGNRESYQNEIAELQSHTNYVQDEDCDFDNTYAHFVFKTPEETRLQILNEIKEENLTPDQTDNLMAMLTTTPKQKFEMAMASLKSAGTA